MKKNIYKIIVSLFFLILGYQAQAQVVLLAGDNAVNSGDSEVYTAVPKRVLVYSANWVVTGGTITSSSLTSVTVTWNSNPGLVTYNVSSSSAGIMQSNLNVTVTANAPAAPPNPTIVSENCSTALLSKTGSIPAGEMWYWQGSNSSGTSTSAPATSNYNVFNTGTFYIRAKNTSSGLWSTNSGAVTISGNVGGVVWYADTDGDGLGDPNTTLTQCSQPLGYVSNGDDQCPTSHGLGSGNGCPGGPTLSNENYVYTIVPQIEITNENMSEIIQNKHAIKSVTYIDGLGRVMQTVGIKQSPNEKDIIAHMEYDDLGREKKGYLPFASTNNTGLYDANAESNTKTFYKTAYADDFISVPVANINPYAEKEFEASPLNRVTKQASPGNDWKLGAGNEVEMEYGSNINAEVRLYKVNLSSSYVPTLALSTDNGGSYAAGELVKTITKDENHTGISKKHTTETFTNARGQVVLKRTYAATSPTTEDKHDTYYVYDDFGNLTYVLPPESGAHEVLPNSTKLSGLCYQYQYDTKNRLIEKQLPGKGKEIMVYDNLDRPVMTQDAVQKLSNKWSFVKYDKLGRVAYTGIYTHGSTLTQTQMQSHVNSTNNTAVEYYEARVSSGTGSQASYYTNTDFPSSNTEILTVNYYDNYSFDLAGSADPEFIFHAFNTPITINTKGMATGSRVKVLGTSHWITMVNYYDVRGRSVYVYSKNDFLGTTDIAQMKLDFVGKVEETIATHTNSSDALSTQTVEDEFEYDHVGRLLKQTQYLNLSNTGEVITSNSYDELGQLITKQVGGLTTDANGLQQVDYKYNVRGWLKSINDVGTSNGAITLGAGDLFGFELNYNNPSNPDPNNPTIKLFNGNISQTLWKTASVNNTSNAVSNMYTYEYDALNRLKSAVDNTSHYNLTNVDYDKNGNITNLQRQGHTNTSATTFGTMDNLIYTYTSDSNQLKKVLDNGADNYGFKDGANLTTEYTYDVNGNMLKDHNKGITTNILYNHLNLPTKVEKSSTEYVEYTYDAVGTRLQKKVTNGSTITTTKYAGAYNYQKIGTSTEVLQFVKGSEGYLEANVSGSTVSYDYVYEFKDHLGNIRLSYSDSNNNGVVTSSEIIEEKNYYPFGLKHQGYNSGSSSNGNSLAQKYGYNGKELNDELGINWHDFSARNYDAALGRWMNIDPLAEQMTRHSPYNYAFNNPVYFIDPDGMKPKGAYNESLENSAVSWSSSNPEDWENHSKSASSLFNKHIIGDPKKTGGHVESYNPNIETTSFSKSKGNTDPGRVLLKEVVVTARTTNRSGYEYTPRDWAILNYLKTSSPGLYSSIRAKNKNGIYYQLAGGQDWGDFSSQFNQGWLGRNNYANTGVAEFWSKFAAVSIGGTMAAGTIAATGMVGTTAGFSESFFTAAANIYLRYQIATGTVVGGSGTTVLLGRYMSDVINPLARSNGYTTITNTLPVIRSTTLTMSYNRAWLQYHANAGSTILMNINSNSGKYSMWMQMEIKLLLDFYSK